MVLSLKMLINGVMVFMKRNTKTGGMNPTPQNNTNRFNEHTKIDHKFNSFGITSLIPLQL